MAAEAPVEQLPPLQGTAGKGVTVVVVTPSAYDHPWFGDRVEGADSNPSPEQIHGTAVVGLVLQRAPGATVVVEPVEEVRGSDASWADALRRAVDRGAEVALLPFGSDRPSERIEEYVSALHATGTAVVAAAGNDASDTVSFPASLRGVVAVGGVGFDADSGTWQPAPFTNRGPAVTVFAPAVDVLTTTVTADDEPQPGFGRISGTSMSAALVAGEVAAEMTRSGVSAPDAVAAVTEQPPSYFVRGLPWAPEAGLADAGEQHADAEAGWELMDARTVANDSATVDDRLGYDVYRDAIVTFLQDPKTRPPLTIGIKGRWGTGKTSLMEMIRQSLDPPVTTETGPDGLRPIPLRDRSEERLSSYAGSDRPAVTRVLRVLRGRPEPLVRPAAGASGARTTGLGVRPPAGTNERGWRPTIWFNPWMYQTGDQVWAGLAHETIRQVTDRMSVRDRERFWLALNITRVDREAVRHRIYILAMERLLPALVAVVVAVGLALGGAALAQAVGAVAATDILQGLGGTAAVASLGVGVARMLSLIRAPAADVLPGLVSAPDAAQSVGSGLRSVASGVVADPAYGARLGLFHLVHTDVSAVLDLVATPERPLVVFVDDLDRCSEGTVAQVVEALNLFVAGQFQNCVFVVAMEPEAVAASIEAAYEQLATRDRATSEPGIPSVGWRFLDKLVQLPVSLPALEQTVVGGLVRAQIAGQQPDSVGGPSAAVRPPAFEKRVQAYESLLSSTPSVEDLNASTYALTDSTIDVDWEAVREAARRVARRRLQADDPEIAAIVDGVVEDLAWNPREIKRFVNLLRFYALVAQEREFRDPQHRLRLDVLSRMALLAIRWPQLRGRLVEPVDGGGSVLGAAEAVLRDATTRSPRAVKKALVDRGVPAPLADVVSADPSLRDFLSRGPSLGTRAVGYL